jgi:hypothetical protein
MKKVLFILVIIALFMFVASCGKSSDKTQDVDDAVELVDEDLDAVDGDDDAALDEAAVVEEGAKPAPAAAVSKADTLENLFTLLDQAIKTGDINKARALYDATSQDKVKTADPALAASTVDGQILFEIENRASYRNASVKVSGSGDKVNVTFPSGKEISGVSIKKVGSEFRIDVVNSPDGDLLDF